MLSWLSPQWICGNSCTRAHDLWLPIASTNEPKSDQEARQGAKYELIKYMYIFNTRLIPDIGINNNLFSQL